MPRSVVHSLWDGNGRVVDGGGEPGLRLKSANAEYADYTAPVGDVHIVGKVLWTVRKV